MVDPSTVTCVGDWRVYESDILEFAALLEFDPKMFGILFGTVVVAFLFGHSIGTVVRLLRKQ